MEATEFLCVRCARHMKTCCQTAEVFVTQGDVARIERHTGQGSFAEFRRPDNPAYIHPEDDEDPVWRDSVFRSDGSRRVLKKQANGDCTFLGAAGCTLPLEVRPLVCRIYPFDYTSEGLQSELATGCPLELLPPGQGLIEALAMNRSDAERWRRQLYGELVGERPGIGTPDAA
jgi:Fe-S-cluster containining protein